MSQVELIEFNNAASCTSYDSELECNEDSVCVWVDEYIDLNMTEMNNSITSGYCGMYSVQYVIFFWFLIVVVV